MSRAISIPHNPSPKSLPHAAIQMKTVLVAQDDSRASEAAFRYGQLIAETFEGHLAGLMFCFIPLSVGGGFVDGYADAWLVARDAAVEAADAQWGGLKPNFDRVMAELRRADVLTGAAGQELALQGRFADAIVVGWSPGRETGLQRELFQGALFESGRPVIVVPEEFKVVSLPRRAVIAWKATRESARAIHDALPLLQKMEAVRLLVVDDGEANLGMTGEPGADAARYLASHGVVADVNFVSPAGRDIATTILDEARYFGAELVVLGGYGHSRTREYIFGGVTRDTLAKTTVPLLMSH